MGKTRSDKFDSIIASETMGFLQAFLERVRDRDAQKKPAKLDFVEYDVTNTEPDITVYQGEFNMIILDRRRALELKKRLEDWLELHPAEKRPRSKMRSKRP